MPAPTLRVAFAVCISWSVAAPIGGAPNNPAPAHAPAAPRRFALLVGCTRYDHVPVSRHLRGPANDVLLMKSLLKERFKFEDADCTLLAEANDAQGQPTGAHGRPTRQNIEQQFLRLIDAVQPGDKVVVLLSGHGAQQPNDNPNDPRDPEPGDGCDEVFLPADIAGWDAAAKHIRGAITDDELHNWLAALAEKGSVVWLVVDACHSGTMMRGADDVVPRGLAPEDFGAPKDLLAQARDNAPQPEVATRGNRPVDDLGLSDLEGSVSALYAARAEEPALERPLPPEAADRKPYGMLTFATVQVLTGTDEPLTYRELVQAIQHQYLRWGGMCATPLTEGTNLDRLVLQNDDWPGRSRILLARDAPNRLSINAGGLHGMTVGTILALHPLADQADSGRLLGHVRVEQIMPLKSTVAPVAFADRPAPGTQDLPEEARCEVVLEDFGDFRMPLAVELNTENDSSDPADDDAWRSHVETALEALDQGAHSFIRRVAPTEARWLLRRHRGGTYLVPATGIAVRSEDSSTDRAAPPSLYGPVQANSNLGEWLTERARRIARVENLLAVAAKAEDDRRAGVPQLDVQLDMVLLPNADAADGEPAPGVGVRQLKVDDLVGFRVANRSTSKVDVTLLIVDSDYQIDAAFPEFAGAGENRIAAGASPIVYRGQVTPGRGIEHVVLIAVPAGRVPIDFNFLAQPSLAASKGMRGGPALETPLGQLLESSMFAPEGRTRSSLKRVDSSRSVMRLVSWQVDGP